MKKWLRFAILTYFVSYVFAGIYYFGFHNKSQITNLAMGILYMWIPALIAIILIKKEGRKIKDISIGFKPNKWFIFAWIIFPILSFITIMVNEWFPGAEFNIYMSGYFEKYKNMLSPEQYQQMVAQVNSMPLLPLILMVVQGLIAGITINLAAAFGEELGWRGYLYKSYESHGFWEKSLYIGAIWGLWHAPLILQGHNYPGYPIAGVFLMILWCILLSPIFTLIREKSKSVIAASIAHGTLNGTAGISIVYIKGGHTLLNGIIGISGCIVLLFANIAIWYYLKRENKFA